MSHNSPLINQPRRLEATTWGMGAERPMNNHQRPGAPLLAYQKAATGANASLPTIAPKAAYVPVTRN